MKKPSYTFDNSINSGYVRIGDEDILYDRDYIITTTTTTDGLDHGYFWYNMSAEWISNLAQFTDTLTMPVWKFVWGKIRKQP